MTAKLQALGGDVAARTFLYENIEGGHGAAADSKQRAFKSTLEFEFLWRRLGPAEARGLLV